MRTYTQEEKQAVIDRIISGEPSARILADTGIPKSTFYIWLRIYREEQNAANRRTVDIRNFHLRQSLNIVHVCPPAASMMLCSADTNEKIQVRRLEFFGAGGGT